MARNVKPIFVHEDVFKSLVEAKLHFEGITEIKMTWSAYLYALACGALALSSLGGLTLHCPLCGDSNVGMYYKKEATQNKP